MISFAQYLERIAAAGSTVELARLYSEHCAAVFGCNSVNFMPVYQPDDPRELVQFHDELSPRALMDMFMDMMPVLESDLGPVVHNRPARGHVVNLNKHFGGPGGWERSRTLNEFMRPHKIDNQMVAYLGEGDMVIACLCLTQRRRRWFTREQERELERITVPTENALLALLHTVNQPGGPNAIVAALEQGLPTMACLFDGQGRLQWISRPAARRLGLRAVRISGKLLLGGRHQALDALRAVARRAAADPAAAVAGKHREQRAVLRPGERLSIRRLPAAPGRGPLLLASIIPRGAAASRRGRPDRARVAALSPRQREVARLAAAGYSMLNIAHRLGIQEATVHTHLKHGYRKLGVSNRAQLAHALALP